MASVRHQNTPRAIRKHRFHLLSYRSRGTLMSYTDHSVQCRFKSNAPNETVRRLFNLHYLPWIYCINTLFTMVLWQKCGIFTLNFITGVMVYI